MLDRDQKNGIMTWIIQKAHPLPAWPRTGVEAAASFAFIVCGLSVLAIALCLVAFVRAYPKKENDQ